jgi:DNA-binding response OmpR family regulator
MIMRKKKKILLVEDNEKQSELISKYLKKKNYSVISVFDGLEAMNQIKKKSFDFIIMDYIIPYLNGLEILNFIKYNKKTAHIPVLIISANEINVKCNFLKKPFKFSDLIVILDQSFISI